MRWVLRMKHEANAAEIDMVSFRNPPQVAILNIPVFKPTASAG